jgi:hypothetical protein
MRLSIVIGTLILASSSPVMAQSLVDTLKSWKKSAESLVDQRESSAERSSTQNTQHTSQGGLANDFIWPDLLEGSSGEEGSHISSTLVQQNPITFDILGTKLGMSSNELNRVARKNNILANGHNSGGDFESVARNLASVKLGHPVPVKNKSYWRDGGGRTQRGATFLFKTTLQPDGIKLSSIFYTAPLGSQTREELIQSLEAKYGKPTFLRGDVFWCSSRAAMKETDCLEAPYLHLSTDARTMSLHLNQGSAYFKKAENALNERVEQIVRSSSAKPDF